MHRPAPYLVIGNGLAAQLTAALLARLGRSVSQLAPDEGWVSDWNSCPPLLVRLLDSLDARSCLRPARPVQIITATQQVELHGGVPLQDELRREFPRSHRQLLDFLSALQRLADRMTDYLWDCEGLPGGFTAWLTSPWQRLRHGLVGRSLNRLLKPELAVFGAEEQAWLRTLLAGYACAAWERMSLAEAALAWAELSSPQELSRSALREQLKNRLVEHAGHWQSIELPVLQLVNEQPLQVRAGEQTLEPAQLLSEVDLSANPPTAASGCRGPAGRFRFAEGHPAGHLADRLLIMTSEQSPLRLALQERDDAVSGHLEIESGATATPAALERVLTEVFPFCRFDLQTTDSSVTSAGRPRFLGLTDKLATPTHRWNLDASRLLPSLGNTGDCLLAMSLVSRLAG